MYDDLIIRKAAIDALTHEWDGMVTSVFDVIKSLPSAQPEIIRCNECKYAHITYGGEVKYCDIWFPDESHYIDTDNYCSFAERRTDDLQ